MSTVELHRHQVLVGAMRPRPAAGRSDWLGIERFTCDGVALGTAFVATELCHLQGPDMALWLPRALSIHWFCLLVSEAYARRDFLFGEQRRLNAAAAKGALAGALILAPFATPRLDAGWLIAHLALYPLTVTLLTLLGRALLSAMSHGGRAQRKVIIAGEAALLESLSAGLAHASSGVQVAAVRAIPRGSVCPESLASTADAISQTARAAGAREVVYCDARLGVDEAAFLAERLLAAGLTIRIVSRRLVRLAGRMPLQVERWRGMPIVEFRAPRATRLAACAKRLLDCLVSAAALAACLPLWATLAPVALVLQGRGLLHRQMRVNRDGRLFEFYKIRTMSSREPLSTRGAAEKVRGPLSKCARDPRITPLGKRLRRFSIDETPQFVNVLVGDISLVGARPPLPDEVAHYAPWQRCRLDGWMGITGLWQTCGRSDLGFGEMVFLDLLYNCNWSLSLDLRILWRTVGAVVSARGAY